MTIMVKGSEYASYIARGRQCLLVLDVLYSFYEAACGIVCDMYTLIRWLGPCHGIYELMSIGLSGKKLDFP